MLHDSTHSSRLAWTQDLHHLMPFYQFNSLSLHSKRVLSAETSLNRDFLSHKVERDTDLLPFSASTFSISLGADSPHSLLTSSCFGLASLRLSATVTSKYCLFVPLLKLRGRHHKRSALQHLAKQEIVNVLIRISTAIRNDRNDETLLRRLERSPQHAAAGAQAHDDQRTDPMGRWHICVEEKVAGVRLREGR
jgi:hypothetical protein